jgi:hypothetical protein
MTWNIKKSYFSCLFCPIVVLSYLQFNYDDCDNWKVSPNRCSTFSVHFKKHDIYVNK